MWLNQSPFKKIFVLGFTCLLTIPYPEVTKSIFLFVFHLKNCKDFPSVVIDLSGIDLANAVGG